MSKQAFLRLLPPVLAISILVPLAGPDTLAQPPQPELRQPSIVHDIQRTEERLQMTASTTRILRLKQKISQVLVDNPRVVDVQFLSANEYQVVAKTPGVTQINVWDVNNKVYTIDVIVYADARELDMLLRDQFPRASLSVVPVGNSVMISGYVDDPGEFRAIIQVAEQHYPSVINRIVVSGVQQVLLHMKVIEVSRTKMRAVGFDFAKLTADNLLVSSPAGLIAGLSTLSSGTATSTSASTVRFNVLDPNSSFLGVLEAIREDRLGKILAEPDIVAISGRPAYFQVGGEIGYQVNGGITGPSVEFKQYGTRIDFMALVLGNGLIHLEVRPMVSEIDSANSLGGIPALKTREVDTSVEMMAGQTLALAGLVQTRVESQNRGLPWISEVPYLGALFRRVENQNNEVELLIMVTPELIEPMDAQQVPPCVPGSRTTVPSDFELFLQGHLEVPNCCEHGEGSSCSRCNNQPDGAKPNSALPPGAVILDESEAVMNRRSPRPAALGARPVRATPQNRHSRYRQDASRVISRTKNPNPAPGFIGPVGYDEVR